jgi:hypothetical protein
MYAQPFEGDNGFDISKPQGTGTRSSSIWQLSTQRHVTWAHLALHGADELRQKMAWSLSQIVAVGLPGSGMVFEEQTEHYIAFYDIFVNHAFGNYRRLMEAFSFNVIMGSWLSFIGNKSLQVNIDEEVRSFYYIVLLSLEDAGSLTSFEPFINIGQGKFPRRELRS